MFPSYCSLPARRGLWPCRARLKLYAQDTITPEVKRLVDLQFATPELKQCFVDKQYARRHFGSRLAERYAYILNFIGCIDEASDLQRFAFLDADAPSNISGSWTISLDGTRRLVLKPVVDGKAMTIMEVAQ